MEWYAISGSWRNVNDRIKKDVEKTVKRIISKGDGIVTGGALGVDYIATETVIKYGNPEKQLKIFLPVKLEILCKHFLKRAEQGILTKEDAEKIIKQLTFIKENYRNCIYEQDSFLKADEESYYSRNTLIVKNCKELYAFHVNNSKGTQDAINKAKQLRKKTHIKKYLINNSQN